MPHNTILAVNADALAPLIELHADAPRYPGDTTSGYTIKSYIPEVRQPLLAWCRTEAEARRKFRKMAGHDVVQMPTPPPCPTRSPRRQRRKKR